MAMAAAVLSAAFVVFLVRERATKAKHVQVSGRAGLLRHIRRPVSCGVSHLRLSVVRPAMLLTGQ